VEFRAAFSETVTQHGIPDTLVLAREHAGAVFTDRRLRIVDHLAEHEPASVRGLARELTTIPLCSACPRTLCIRRTLRGDARAGVIAVAVLATQSWRVRPHTSHRVATVITRVSGRFPVRVVGVRSSDTRSARKTPVA
jgi:hypothetical protein